MAFTGKFTYDGHPISLFKSKSSSSVQDFYSIRQKCLKSKSLFEDPEFPCTDKSLFFSHPADHRYEWLRPNKICVDPKFVVEGCSRFDVLQGELGNCWFLVAAANLTQDTKLFTRVVCEDNSFEESYAGIFHFRFWQYGNWVDVVIDDRLPTHRGQLLYMHSNVKKEFWSALLEKAYAKLYGSYEALKTGATSEALGDFTGGVTEMYRLKEPPPNLFEIIEKGFLKSSMMGCSIDAEQTEHEVETPEGLVRGHAYSINKAVMADVVTPKLTGKVPLLRLRNPWGNEIEWNGNWSDKSPQWQCVPEHVKENLGLTCDDDGEFWMSYRDFLKHFDRMDVCNLSPNSLGDQDELEKKWNNNVFEGEWISGVSAGGCRNFLETFHRNPQFVLTVTEPDANAKTCTVVVALMQKNRRIKHKEFLTIGYMIYPLKVSDLAVKPQPMEFFKYTASCARSQGFLNMREVNHRFQLEPGHYLIVPSTYSPDEEGEFLIRVFTECNHLMEENDKTVNIEVHQFESRGTQTLDHFTLKLTPEYEKLFFQVAGPSKDIGWKELKLILDVLLKEGFEEQIGSKMTKADLQLNLSNEKVVKGKRERFLSLVRSMFTFNKRNFSKSADLFSKLVTESDTLGFSESICRSMVAMLDADYSGKLDFDEFKLLFNDVVMWKAAFKLYDKDQSNRLDVSELRDAFAAVGYQLNTRILNSLAYRYGSDQQTISLDDFILCAVKVKTMMQHFKKKDFENKDEATFTTEEWITKAVYC